MDVILTAQDIHGRTCLTSPLSRLVIDPFHPRTVHNGMTYGLSACGYDVRVSQACVLKPGGFQLVSTIERLEIPPDIRATVADKSSWARQGLAVQNTRFEPGWRGYPTLELSNHGPRALRIPAGMPIAQVEFTMLTGRTAQPYDGKYQDQPSRPVEAIHDKDGET